MYKRELAHEITDKLQKNPAVAILGPHQVGKTTLALEIGKDRPSIVHTLLQIPNYPPAF